MKACVDIVDLPMKVAVENVKREGEFCDSSQASLKSNLDCCCFFNAIKFIRMILFQYWSSGTLGL